MKNIMSVTITIGALLLFTISTCGAAPAISRGKRLYIKDRTGELWDITEARKQGVKIKS